jgi:hypothetical protein
MLATIFGTPPPAGTVAIDDQRAGGSLLRFFAETRMAGQRRVADRPKEHVRGRIEDQDVEKMRQKLSDKIDRVRQRLNLEKTGGSSEGCAREDHQFAA